MDINEDHPNENKQTLFIQFIIAREVAIVAGIRQTLEVGREVGELYRRKKEGFPWALPADCWHVG